jgi:hypothetical protein
MKTASLLVFGLAAACLPWVAPAQSNYIPNVPDVVMPPKAAANWPVVGRNNFCTPIAAENVVRFWDGNGYPGVAGNPSPGFGKLAYMMGWFMDTNDWTVADDAHLGTWNSDPNASGFDALGGIISYARWDATHNMFCGKVPPGPRPIGKVGYNWGTTLIGVNGYANAMAQIDAGRPLLTSWTHWGIGYTNQKVNINGTQYEVWDFGDNPGSISGKDEYGDDWSQDFGLGHTVTTVGYSSNFNLGPNNNVDLLVVHDGVPWAGQGFLTPIDFAVVYRANLWTGNIDVNPVPEPGTVTMLLAGVAGVFAFRRRMR